MGLFSEEQLSDPSDSVQYALEHLAWQKEQFARELPFLVDMQALRVNAHALKQLLEPTPGELLAKIYLSLPP